MATIGISSEGKASVLGMVSTARDSHRVTTDGRDQVYAMKQVTVKITSCWVLMRLQSFEIRNLINAKVPA